MNEPATSLEQRAREVKAACERLEVTSLRETQAQTKSHAASRVRHRAVRQWERAQRLLVAAAAGREIGNDEPEELDVDDVGDAERPPMPRIVCICGSTRFIDVIAVLAWELEKRGAITVKPNLLPRWYAPDNKLGHHMAEHQGLKAELDALHMRKIDLSDEVVVVDLAGYIGESTRAEIAHANTTGKPVRYLSIDAELGALIPGSQPIPGDDTPFSPGLAGMRVSYGAACTTGGCGKPTIGVCFECMGVQCLAHAGESHACPNGRETRRA
jgi:hypothetical protein